MAFHLYATNMEFAENNETLHFFVAIYIYIYSHVYRNKCFSFYPSKDSILAILTSLFLVIHIINMYICIQK